MSAKQDDSRRKHRAHLNARVSDADKDFVVKVANQSGLPIRELIMKSVMAYNQSKELGVRYE